MFDMQISYDAPLAEEYIQLRIATGLSPRDLNASQLALQNSIFSIPLRHEGKLIGMGRIIGDGGCFFQIVDIAVNPLFQGKGLGKLILEELTKYLDETVPSYGDVSLIAYSC